MPDTMRLILFGIFYLLAGIIMVLDIRRRTFPAWIGWALYLLAVIYLSYFGFWNRIFILLATVIGFRLRRYGALAMAILTALIFLLGRQEGVEYVSLSIGVYFLFLLGWLGSCDAEIIFPLIALTGGEAIAMYLLLCWVLVPPFIVFFKRGLSGGIRRFSEVAFRLFITRESALEDKEALRVPWTIYPFVALTAYLFFFPGNIYIWWAHLFP
jgi:hypothetical protein